MNLILFIIAEVERKLKFKMSLFRTKTHFKKKKSNNCVNDTTVRCPLTTLFDFFWAFFFFFGFFCGFMSFFFFQLYKLWGQLHREKKLLK